MHDFAEEHAAYPYVAGDAKTADPTLAEGLCGKKDCMQTKRLILEASISSLWLEH